MRSLVPVLIVAVALAGCSCSETEKRYPAFEIRGTDEGVFPFPSTTVGERSESELIVLNHTKRTLTLAITSPDAPFDVQPSELTIPAGANAGLTIGFAPETAGAHAATFVVQGGGRSEQVKLEGSAAEGALHCDARLDFGAIQPQSARSRTVECENRGETDLAFSASVEGSSFALAHDDTIRMRPGTSQVIRVDFLPTTTGESTGTLVLHREESLLASVELHGRSVESAVEFADECLDFGFLKPEKEAVASFDLVNLDDRDLEVKSIHVDPGPFVLESGPKKLLASGTTPIELRFSPQAIGGAQSNIRVVTSAGEASACIRAFSGGPALVCDTEVDFGLVSAGLPVRRRISCLSDGTFHPDAGLRILGFDVGDAAGISVRLVENEPDGGFPSGTEFEIEVEYDAPGEGSLETPLVIQTNSPNGETFVTLRAQAIDGRGCELATDASTLDFGRVDGGGAARLDVRLDNVGDAPCLLRDFDLSGSTYFSAPFPEGLLLQPGELHDLVVDFAGADEKDVEQNAILSFETSGTATPRVEIALRGVGTESCLRFGPGDFGNVRPVCGPHELLVQVENGCEGSLTFTDAAPLSSSSGEFALDVSGLTSIPSGSAATVAVHYTPVDESGDFGGFVLEFEELQAPTLFVSARADDAARSSERYFLDPLAHDVLFVVSDRVGMALHQATLADGLSDVLWKGRTTATAYQLGVTTTSVTGDSCAGGGAEAGRLLPPDDASTRILTPQHEDLYTAWEANVSAGDCRQSEEGLEAMALALGEPLLSGANAGFRREDASLSVVFVTHEDDDASPSTPADYADLFADVPGFSAHELHFGDCAPGRYAAFVDEVGGERVCVDANANAFLALSEAIFHTPRQVPLAGSPVDVDGDGSLQDDVELLLNGAAIDVDFELLEGGGLLLAEDPGMGILEIRYVGACSP